LELDLIGGEVLWPDGSRDAGRVSLAGGRFVAAAAGRQMDVSGFLVLPGLVDCHGDGFELNLAPRRGAMPDMAEGVIATETELAGNGITTAVMAQFFSWEGGLRGPEHAALVFRAMAEARPRVATDLIAQLRFETHMLDDYARLPALLRDWDIRYLVFNDHLPHERLAQGRTPPRLTGQALKAGRSPEAHLAMLQEMHRRSDEVPAALDALCAGLSGHDGLRLGSHDDHTAEQRAAWHARGARIAEFPETMEAAQAARDAGDRVIMGAPNVVRGGSHKRNIGARDLVAAGLCDALASDYHYPAMRRAVLTLVREGVCDFAGAWHLVSSGPAEVLGLTDRGRIAPGQRADLVLLERDTLRVAATFAGGCISYLSGEIGKRLLEAS
jgi:alpha-D-ribose 1-methylphosphonate 5-triphosphate diphosphatase